MSLWMWLLSAALGSGFYLEGPHLGTRGDVLQMQREVIDAGHSARIVRRFVEGQGWRFLLRVEGFEGQGDAQRAAADLADRLSTGLDILYTDGSAVRFVGRQDVGALSLEGGDPDRAPDEDLHKAARAVLERSAAAHGVDRDTLTRWMEGPSILEYRRTLDDGTVVDQSWSTRDGAVYVRVHAVVGQAVSSRLFVRGDEAWLAVGDGPWDRHDVARARSVMEDFGPAAAIPLVFVFRHAMEARREFAFMEYAGEGQVGDEATHVLGYAGDQETPALILEVGQADALVRRVSLAGGQIVHELDDYRRIGDLMLPFRVVSRRVGGLGDIVEVAVLINGPEALDAGVAIPPGAGLPPP